MAATERAEGPISLAVAKMVAREAKQACRQGNPNPVIRRDSPSRVAINSGPSGFNPVEVEMLVRLMWLGWIRRPWPASGAFALLTRVDHECLTIAASTAMIMIRSHPVPVA